jgi:hypothetical protein
LASNLDLIQTRIQRQQAWHLLPDMAVTAVAIAQSTSGPAPFNMFPQWLGKNSKRLKHMRQIHDIARRSKHTGTALREDYWTPVNVIGSATAANPAEFGEFLSENKWTRDDYFETLMETMFEPVVISTKEKTAITRAFNKQNKSVGKKTASDKSIKKEITDDGEAEEDESEDELKYYL